MNERVELVITILEEAAQLKLKFEHVTAIAEYVVARINNIRKDRAVQAALSMGGDESSVEIVPLSRQALLRTRSRYRKLLDSWVEANVATVEVAGELSRDDYLRMYISVCNELHAAKLEIEQLSQNVPQRSLGSTSLVNHNSSTDDAFLLVQMLLREFKDFWIFDGEQIVTSDALHRVIGSSDVMRSYLEWNNRLVKVR